MMLADCAYWCKCLLCEYGKALLWKINGSDECRESPYQPNVFKGCERKVLVKGNRVHDVHLGAERLELDLPEKRPSAKWFRRPIIPNLNEIWKVFIAACIAEGMTYEDAEDSWLGFRRLIPEPLQIHYNAGHIQQLLVMLRNEKEAEVQS